MNAEFRMRIAECKSKNPKSEIRNLKSGGFTLIEIIITIAVIAIAAVGVMAVFSTGMLASADPLLVSQATQLAQAELDTVVGTRIAAGFNAGTIPAQVGTQTCRTQTALLPNFNCTLNICYVSPTDFDNTSSCTTATSYKRVLVTITNTARPIGNVTAVTLLTSY